jgi:hypothetical protein
LIFAGSRFAVTNRGTQSGISACETDVPHRWTVGGGVRTVCVVRQAYFAFMEPARVAGVVDVT